MVMYILKRSIEFELLATATTGGTAWWVMPSGEIHTLPDNYYHDQKAIELVDPNNPDLSGSEATERLLESGAIQIRHWNSKKPNSQASFTIELKSLDQQSLIRLQSALKKINAPLQDIVKLYIISKNNVIIASVLDLLSTKSAMEANLL